jgi:predicted neutral ceramidase superfamily lipid hydrolase
LIEILFLLGFTLHNIEEALWLPGWSKGAGKYHAPVGANGFRFGVIAVTVMGYLLTFLDHVLGGQVEIIRYAYLGFVSMMVLNAVFPHLAATVAMRSYAPGLMTGLCLNVPMGIYLVFVRHGAGLDPLKYAAATILVSAVVLVSLKPLFWLGKKLIGNT